jgi:hypothetical protein
VIRRNVRRLAAILIAVPFLAFGEPDSSNSESGQDPITLKAFRVLPTDKVIAIFKNDSGKPVKAFRGTWSVFNDFNEVSQSGGILFTSDTLVIGDRGPINGYIFPANGIIYLGDDGKNKVAMIGRVASETFGNLEAVPEKPVKVVITDVVFAQDRPPTQQRSDVSDDVKVITDRVNAFYAKHQVPTYDVVEGALRKEYLTERFQRERADEDKHPENTDGDSYTLSDGGWDVGAIRVIDVRVQGSRAEVSVSRGGTNHNMEVSVVKERGKWLIDRIYFAR